MFSHVDKHLNESKMCVFFFCVCVVFFFAFILFCEFIIKLFPFFPLVLVPVFEEHPDISEGVSRQVWAP